MKYERVDRPDADPIIERGIPLPALERAKYRKNSWARITDMMEVGDSVQVNTYPSNISRSAARRLTRPASLRPPANTQRSNSRAAPSIS
jgi:hypothetical protein